jgi:hypothetical protein
VLLCLVVGLHDSYAQDITSSTRQAETPLQLVANDLVLKGQTHGATCPMTINIKTVRSYRGSYFEQILPLIDPGASRLPLGQFFGIIRVNDVVVGGAQCTGNAETIIAAPASLPRLLGLLEAAPSSLTGILSEYGTFLRGMVTHARDSTKAVGKLLSENNKPVSCGTDLYPAFVFFLTDIANDAKQLAARLNLNSADQMKGNLILVTSAKVPLTADELVAFESGTERLCAYGVAGKPAPASPASASSSAATSGNGASASANANPGTPGTGADATASTSGDSRRGPSTSTSTSTSGNGASASADASQGTGPRADAETSSGASQPGASSSTSTSGPGASASADANAGAGPMSNGGSASSSSESSGDGTDGGSVSCRKSTSQQGSGSSSASCG